MQLFIFFLVPELPDERYFLFSRPRLMYIYMHGVIFERVCR